MNAHPTTLHEFITTHRDQVIASCRAKISSRPAPRATDIELEHGVPLFLDQLTDALRTRIRSHPEIGATATKHGDELLRRGFTIAQVVHDYGGVCQAITELAVETGAPITAGEFQTLNLCLDDAIASAVSEYSRLREHEGVERLGQLAHELRNLLNGAFLAYEILKGGSVGVGGSTGAVLGKSLAGLRRLVDRELAEVRLGAGIVELETVVVREFIEDAEVAATMAANAHGIRLSVRAPIGLDVTVRADRQILASVVANLVQNAIKFTRRSGEVVLHAYTTGGRVLIDVEDECGGLPPGRAEDLFRSFEQRGADRTGLGLGLAICRRGTEINGGEIRLVDRPGIGCVFTVDLPRHTG